MEYAPHPTHAERESAKRILCALLQHNGGAFKGQTLLYKAFYWAHLYYWKEFPGVLTTYPFARMPYGPGIHGGEDLLFEMQRDNLIRIEDRNPTDPYGARSFRLTMDFSVNLTPKERRAVEYGLKKVRGRRAFQASREAHGWSRSWKRSRDGQVINIYEDLLTERQFQENWAANRAAAKIADRVFS